MRIVLGLLESAKGKGCADVVELEEELVLVVVEPEELEELIELVVLVVLVVEEDIDDVLMLDVIDVMGVVVVLLCCDDGWDANR